MNIDPEIIKSGLSMILFVSARISRHKDKYNDLYGEIQTEKLIFNLPNGQKWIQNGYIE